MTMNFAVEAEATSEKQYSCGNCHKTFGEPVLVKYYACPHCKSKIEEQWKTGCQYWFGYLNEKDKDESMPHECVECGQVVDCMLNHQ